MHVITFQIRTLFLKCVSLFYAGLAGSIVTGALGGVGGFGISSLVKNLGMKGITKLLVKLPHLAKLGAFSSLIGKGVEQALSEDGFNARDLALSFVNGFINGWIPIPKIGPKRLGDVLSNVAGSAISSATGIYVGGKTKVRLCTIYYACKRING